MGNKNYNNNENKSINNNESSSQYQLIFHYPINKNDCINSIDIFDDKVAIGTIMGDALLLRVDKNNLEVKGNKHNQFLNYNSDSDNNNLISKESSTLRNKKSFIKLNNVESGEININNYSNKKLNKRKNTKEENTKDISKVSHELKKIKMIRLNKLDESSHHNSNNTATKKRNIKIKNIKIHNEEKKMASNNDKDLTKIEDEEEKEIENNKENIHTNDSFNKIKNNENNINPRENDSKYKDKKFPQISKIIESAIENICCIQFDTEKILNISVGDFEILRIKDIHEFNMNNPYSGYKYSKIKNYDDSHKHFKYCENSICMATSTHFLIIFANFVNFNSELKQEKYKYNNINLVEENKIQGKIQMYNFSIPFDFDGKSFLFLEYTSKEDRNICLFDTINKSYFYKHGIEPNFGHISHMKILTYNDKKIFLCRNDLQCEIHTLDKDFSCIESFEHIGNDIINIFIYFKESKLSDEFKKKITDEKNKNNTNKNNNNYEEYIKMNNNNKSKSIIKINDEISNRSNRSKNNEKITLIKNLEFNNENNILNINISNSSKNKKKQDKSPKEIKLLIKEESDNSSIKNINSQEKNNNLKNSAIQIFNKNKIFEEESKVPIKEENFSEKNNSSNKYKKEILNHKKDVEIQNTIDIEDKGEAIDYYIFIIDSNGDLNMYKNKRNRTLFNLYNVEGIDESYKDKKFFAIGYPYYFVLNELYFAITTDFGLFVISNNSKEL